MRKCLNHFRYPADEMLLLYTSHYALYIHCSDGDASRSGYHQDG